MNGFSSKSHEFKDTTKKGEKGLVGCTGRCFGSRQSKLLQWNNEKLKIRGNQIRPEEGIIYLICSKKESWDRKVMEEAVEGRGVCVGGGVSLDAIEVYLCKSVFCVWGKNEHTQPQTSQSPFCHEGAVWLLLRLINTSHLWTTVTEELCFSPGPHPYLTFLCRPTPSPPSFSLSFPHTPSFPFKCWESSELFFFNKEMASTRMLDLIVWRQK